MKALVTAVCSLLPLPCLAAQPSGPLGQRAEQVAQLLAAEPSWPDDLFDASFTKAVPPDQLRGLCQRLYRQHGRIEALNLLHRDSELAGKFEAILAKGSVMPVTIGLLPKAPHSIVTLWFGPPAPGIADLDAAIVEIAKLPGEVSFGVYALDDDGPRPIAEHQGEKALALGSAFKLYVLGELVRAVAAGERQLDDVVSLEKRWTSLPSGRLQRWPMGSPVTLHSLAAAMISESDNTATDHLLFTLGREKVEAMLEVMGNGAAPRNRPFLSTGEMFRLKYVDGGKAGDEYSKLKDTAARRAFLDEQVAAIPLDEGSLDPGAFAEPRFVDTIEWFASARDLARAMDWLRHATGTGGTELLRGVLSINPGVGVSKDAFPFVGYKGGSEVGVLNLTFLLRAKGGRWYSASAGWNDPAEPVDDARLIGLMTRVLYLVGKTGGE